MSTAVTLPVPATIYREEQLFGWWVYALLAGMVLGGVLVLSRLGPQSPAPIGQAGSVQLPMVAVTGFGLPAMLLVGVLRMTTEVHPGAIRVWFGFVPTYRKAIALDGVKCVEVVRYRPWVECRGWGVRRGRDGERVYNARGVWGVRLHFHDGSRVLIGSQRPEPLAAAIERALPERG